MSKVYSLFFLALFLSLPLSAITVCSAEIVINEIAWMGTENSYNDEWIELYNNSSSDLELKGWRLVTEGGNPEIILKGNIPSKGFFILERTDDTSLPKIKADLIYKGNLNNKGEHLKLVDNKEKIIDEVDCSSGWFRGDNEGKQTMERKNQMTAGNNPKNWQNSQDPGGTPKDKNSQPVLPSLSNGGTTETEFPLVEDREGLAAIGKPLLRSSNPLWIFLIAIGISIVSGAIALFSKRY